MRWTKDDVVSLALKATIVGLFALAGIAAYVMYGAARGQLLK